MMSRIGKKQGFTIAELMLTMLILVMVAGVMTAGVSVASKAYKKVVESANAQLLYSTTLTALRTALGSANEVAEQDEDTNSISYYSAETGYTTIACAEDGIWIKPYLTAEYGTGTTDYSRLLVSLAAADGLVVQFDSITYSCAAKLFTITGLSVTGAGGELLAGAESDTFTIRAVNAQTEAE